MEIRCLVQCLLLFPEVVPTLHETPCIKLYIEFLTKVILHLDSMMKRIIRNRLSNHMRDNNSSLYIIQNLDSYSRKGIKVSYQTENRNLLSSDMKTRWTSTLQKAMFVGSQVQILPRSTKICLNENWTRSPLVASFN